MAHTLIDSFAVCMRKTPKPYRVGLFEFRVKIYYSIKGCLTLALWTTVLRGLTGWKAGQKCFLNVDAFTQTNNVVVTYLPGKYLDILWNRCTSYQNESVKIVITEFCFIPWTFLLIFISLLGMSWEYFYVLVLDFLLTFKLNYIS